MNPATLDAVARLCRICGNPNAVIFRLKDKIELLERVDKVLGLKIDLDVSHLFLPSTHQHLQDLKILFFRLMKKGPTLELFAESAAIL